MFNFDLAANIYDIFIPRLLKTPAICHEVIRRNRRQYLTNSRFRCCHLANLNVVAYRRARNRSRDVKSRDRDRRDI